MLTNYFYWRYLFGEPLIGIVFLVAGLVTVRRQLSFRPDDWPVLGRVFVAAPFGVLVAYRVSEARINDTPLASGPTEIMATPKMRTTTARLPIEIE